MERIITKDLIKLGEYSFFLWLPTIIVGIIITGIGADDK